MTKARILKPAPFRKAPDSEAPVVWQGNPDMEVEALEKDYDEFGREWVFCKLPKERQGWCISKLLEIVEGELEEPDNTTILDEMMLRIADLEKRVAALEGEEIPDEGQ